MCCLNSAHQAPCHPTSEVPALGCACRGGQGESGWSQTRVPDPALQNPECQQLNKECLEQTGAGEGLSYVTKAQKRWARSQMEQTTRPGMVRGPGRV